jgi:yersiniabactin synthetase, thiazolinyl reductase component
MRPLQVLVCGSNYGRSYVTALRHEPRKYELAGILARGSARSQRIAAANGVPLYRSTDEIPDNIGVACAAMSSTAWPLVLKLVRRGIHVLCEHPYPAGRLRQALALASKHNVQFHVNGHFASLPAPQAFVRECQRTAKPAGPEFVDVMATERSLYGALDILASAVGQLSPSRVRVLSRRAKFVLLEGAIGKLPARLTVQVSSQKDRGQLADGSLAYLLDLRLTVAFPTGLLTLLSIAGPVVWTKAPAQVWGNREPLSTIYHHQNQTLADLGQQRIQANVEALNSLRNAILGHGAPKSQQPEHILRVSKAWEHIGRQLYSD